MKAYFWAKRSPYSIPCAGVGVNIGISDRKNQCLKAKVCRGFEGFSFIKNLKKTSQDLNNTVTILRRKRRGLGFLFE